MADETDLSEAIAANAQGPKEVKGDVGTMTQHSLKDQIEADRYMQSKKAMRSKNPLRMTRIIPGGTE